MFGPDSFSIAPFDLHVFLNLKPCAKMQKQFQLQNRASRARSFSLHIFS